MHGPREPGPRARAIALGLLLIPLVCGWSLRTELISGGSELIEGSLLPLVVFVLFVLTLANDLVRRWRPHAALTRAELLLIYVLQTASVGVAGLGQLQFLNQALAGATVHARPENGWAQQLSRFIPPGWTPDPAVLDTYNRGNSTLFTAENLRGWATPVLLWTGFMLALLFGFLCLSVLLRRPWVEHERLPFPLVALPLQLTDQGAARGLVGNRTFWLAFLIACVFRSLSALHRVEPRFPESLLFNTGKGQLIALHPFFTDFPLNQLGYFALSFHPMVIGVTYFLPQDVAFSAWFFYLLVKAENLLAALAGFRSAGAGPSVREIPYTGEQGLGSFLAIACLSLWSARAHLGAVWRQAMGTERADDDGEILSYRTAVIGLGGAVAAVVLFAVWGGMPLGMALGFFGLYLLMIVTIARLRAEAGPLLHYGPDMSPHRLLTQIPGPRAWDGAALTTLTYFTWMDSDYRTVALPQQLEATRINDGRIAPRQLGRWLMVASILAVVSSWVIVLALYYHYGASTPRGDNGWRVYNGRMPFEVLSGWLANPLPAEPGRLLWVGVGTAITGLLTIARSRFAWWPLHPAGFAMVHAGYTMHWVWLPTFFGWLAKGLILRYGGMALYRRGMPFFLGLILGDIVIACLWSMLGVLLDTQMYMFFPG
jgi:hypothetical protein